MNNKRIGIIARGLSNGGVTQFISNVLDEFNDMKLDIDIIVFTDEAAFAKKYPNLEVVYIKKHYKLVWDNILLPLKAARLNLYTLIYTKNIIPLTNLLFPWKKLVVVYDLGYLYSELNAYKFWDTLYMKLMMGISFRFADKIMAISKFTKSEIIKFFNVPDQKIFVNYLGVSDKYRVIKDEKLLKAVQEKYHLELPFIFYVGSLSPRKNILRVLKAFNIIKDKVPHQFYLISSRSWNATEIYDFIDNNLNERVRIIENVPDDDLVIIYNLAEALIYISLYEGFGLPILEALACGCKAITSKKSSCEEIGADFVISTDSQSASTISNILLEELTQENYYMKKEAAIYSKKFKWSLTSESLVFHSIYFISL